LTGAGRVLALCAVLLLACAHSEPAPDVRASALGKLPPAPAGFSWVMYRNAALLKPDGWHEQTLTDAYVISPEDSSEMRATVEVISRPKALLGLEARTAAFAYLEPFADAHAQPEQVLLFDEKQLGPFQLIGFRYRDARPGETPVIVHKHLMANAEADSVHVFTFESPEATWPESWEKFGIPILSVPVVFPMLPSDE